MTKFMAGILFGLATSMFLWSDLIYEMGYKDGYYKCRYPSADVSWKVNHVK